jgi:hypothetical protein
MEDRRVGGIDGSARALPAHGEPTVGPAQRGTRYEVVRGSSEWHNDAKAWIAAVLAAEGIVVLGDLSEYRRQPWSSIWTVATDHGPFWLKENGPSQYAEGSVHVALARLAPSYVDAPVAIDPRRRWTLSRDGGTIAETLVEEPTGVPTSILIEMVRDYARLQRLTADHHASLAQAGLRDVAPRDTAALARSQAEYLVSLDSADPRSMREEQYLDIMAALPALEEAGEALAAGPVPSMLDQGDLLPTNAFLPRRGGHFRVFDFADAVWTHPFCSMVMLAKDYLRRSDRARSDNTFDLRGERIRAVLDAYLEEWVQFASVAELRVLIGYALRIGPLLRSSAWLQAFESCDAKALAERGDGAWWWLQRLTKTVVL